MTNHEFVSRPVLPLPVPDNRRAAVFFLIGVLVSTAMLWMIKTLGQHYGPFQIILVRGGVMAVALAPFALAQGPMPATAGTPLKLVGRSLLAFGGQAMGIAAIAALPLAQAQSLSFTKGFIVLGLAALILREQVGVRRWAAMVIGLAGVLIMLQPSQGFNPEELLALGSAACFAGSTIIVKALTRQADRLTLIFWGAVGQSVLALPLALFWWVAPTPGDWGIMLCLGLVAIVLQVAMLSAWRLGEVSALAPLDYLRLVTGTALGFLAFGETPEPEMFAGAGLIIVANIVAVARNRRMPSADNAE